MIKLLKFPKSTEIGCREGAAQRKLECEQRNDEERENLCDWVIAEVRIQEG